MILTLKRDFESNSDASSDRSIQPRLSYTIPPAFCFLVYSVIIVFMACGLEISKHYFAQEHFLEAARNDFRASVLGQLFAPVPGREPQNWTYLLRV